MPLHQSSNRLIVGLSGASASGKTTVARLIRDILPLRVIILHQDDFFLPEADLPIVDGLADWDSAGSLDIDGMAKAINHLRDTGEVPPGFTSKEDRNEIGPSGISEETIEKLQKETNNWLIDEGVGKEVREKEVFLIDGFLLFGQGVKQLRDGGFDLKLLLRASYEKGKKRREGRSGYATIEGFWTDPPGYWDKIVWPSYVREHAFMFRGGDVEGEPEQEVLDEIGVKIFPGGGESDVESLLRWVLDEVKKALVEVR